MLVGWCEFVWWCYERERREREREGEGEGAYHPPPQPTVPAGVCTLEGFSFGEDILDRLPVSLDRRIHDTE